MSSTPTNSASVELLIFTFCFIDVENDCIIPFPLGALLQYGFSCHCELQMKHLCSISGLHVQFGFAVHLYESSWGNPLIDTAFANLVQLILLLVYTGMQLPAVCLVFLALPTSNFIAFAIRANKQSIGHFRYLSGIWKFIVDRILARVKQVFFTSIGILQRPTSLPTPQI